MIGCFLDLDNGVVGFSKNGNYLGEAFRFETGGGAGAKQVSRICSSRETTRSSLSLQISEEPRVSAAETLFPDQLPSHVSVWLGLLPRRRAQAGHGETHRPRRPATSSPHLPSRTQPLTCA